MADGTVDNLQIQLSADAAQAVKSLNELSDTLRSINSVFTKDISGMRKFTEEIGALSGAIGGLGKVKIDLGGLNTFIKNLNNIDSSKIANASKGIKEVSDSMSELGKTNFNANGINKTVNSIKRLVSVDTGKFNPSDFDKITNSISNLGKMPDVSSTVNRFVSSLTRLANAGEKTGQSASGLANLGRQLKKTVKTFSGIKSIDSDVNSFVSSVSRLANAGGKTGQTASGLSALSKETIEFFKAMQDAPKVSENTIRMTEALAKLATSGSRVSSATGQVSSAFSKLSNLSSKAGNIVSAAGKKIASAFKSIGDSGKHVNNASSFLGNFIKGALLYQGTTGLIDLAKSSINLGSSITEVENVVDVAFGNMSQSAYDFASTATEQFGLSELAAKQYSGTMMAILTSSGVTQDAAAEMSTTLAGLAGDLASFYNISTDDAFMKLRSAIAGETEPMRQLGVNMTVKFLLRLYTAMYIESLRERMQKRCVA